MHSGDGSSDEPESSEPASADVVSISDTVAAQAQILADIVLPDGWDDMSYLDQVDWLDEHTSLTTTEILDATA